MQASCVNTDVSIVCYRSVSEGSSLCIHGAPRRQRPEPSLTLDRREPLMLELLGMAADQRANFELISASEEGKSEVSFFCGRDPQYYYFYFRFWTPDLEVLKN